MHRVEVFWRRQKWNLGLPNPRWSLEHHFISEMRLVVGIIISFLMCKVVHQTLCTSLGIAKVCIQKLAVHFKAGVSVTLCIDTWQQTLLTLCCLHHQKSLRQTAATTGKPPDCVPTHMALAGSLWHLTELHGSSSASMLAGCKVHPGEAQLLEGLQ